MATLTLQPTGGTGLDNSIYQDSPTDNNSTSTTMDCLITAGTNKRRSLVTIDISSMPVGATITSAILTLTNGRTIGGTGNVQIDVVRVTQTYVDSQATYNVYSTGNNWATAGGDFNATIRASATPANPTIGTVTTWDITTLVQDWYSGASTNQGFIMKCNNETSNSKGVSFATSDHATSDYQPKLVITYTLPGNSHSFLMFM